MKWIIPLVVFVKFMVARITLQLTMIPPRILMMVVVYTFAPPKEVLLVVSPKNAILTRQIHMMDVFAPITMNLLDV
tara:strand:- start:404 stop:631 length:228 start_codon:yes stop_codon:yes gene_type:complete